LRIPHGEFAKIEIWVCRRTWCMSGARRGWALFVNPNAPSGPHRGGVAGRPNAEKCAPPFLRAGRNQQRFSLGLSHISGRSYRGLLPSTHLRVSDTGAPGPNVLHRSSWNSYGTPTTGGAVRLFPDHRLAHPLVFPQCPVPDLFWLCVLRPLKLSGWDDAAGSMFPYSDAEVIAKNSRPSRELCCPPQRRESRPIAPKRIWYVQRNDSADRAFFAGALRGGSTWAKQTSFDEMRVSAVN